jgi:hypothetical protein
MVESMTVVANTPPIWNTLARTRKRKSSRPAPRYSTCRIGGTAGGAGPMRQGECPRGNPHKPVPAVLQRMRLQKALGEAGEAESWQKGAHAPAWGPADRAGPRRTGWEAAVGSGLHEGGRGAQRGELVQGHDAWPPCSPCRKRVPPSRCCLSLRWSSASIAMPRSCCPGAPRRASPHARVPSERSLLIAPHAPHSCSARGARRRRRRARASRAIAGSLARQMHSRS